MLSAVPTLATERLRLRPFTLADAPTVRDLAGAAEMAATTLNIPHPYPPEAAETWIAAQPVIAAGGAGLTWAIERQADGVLLGAMSLGIAARHARAELGYWLGAPYGNQGYMSEAAQRVAAYGFDTLGLHRLQAGCFPRNRASARVMEKAGLVYEGLLRGYVRKGDYFEDVAMYARLRG